MRKLKFRTDDKELLISCHSGINTIHPILRMTLCSPFLTTLHITCHSPVSARVSLSISLTRFSPDSSDGSDVSRLSLWPGEAGHWPLSLSGPPVMAGWHPGPHGQTNILPSGTWHWDPAVKCEIWNVLDSKFEWSSYGFHVVVVNRDRNMKIYLGCV